MNTDEMSREDLIAALAAEKATPKSKIVIKVSPKGCIQVNGIRRFPLSFYKNEWAQMFALREEIEQFAKDHDSELATK
jgi:hypothetical protein